MYIQLMLLFFFGIFIQFMLIKIGHRIELYSKPNFRRKKKEIIPLVGGLGIFALLILSQIIFKKQNDELSFKILISALPVFIVSLLDDKYELSAKIKLPFQILSALIFVYWVGVDKLFYTQLIGSSFWGPIVSAFFIMIVINAYNFLDGVDGHLATLVLIALVSLQFLFQEVSGIHFALIAGVISFLMFNVSPAKAYLGDGGSSLLGFCTGAIATQLHVVENKALSFWAMNFIFSLAFCDVWAAIIRRLNRKQPPWKGDREHFHHKLLFIGVNTKLIMFVSGSMMVVSSLVAYSILNTYGEQFNFTNWILVISSALALMIIYFGVFLLEKHISIKVMNSIQYNLTLLVKTQKIIKPVTQNKMKFYLQLDLSLYSRELQYLDYAEAIEFIKTLLGSLKNYNGVDVLIYNNKDHVLIFELNCDNTIDLQSARRAIIENIKNILLDYRLLKNESLIPEGLSILTQTEAIQQIQWSSRNDFDNLSNSDLKVEKNRKIS